MIYTAERSDEEVGHEELTRLLKRCRLRIPKDCASLGEWRRTPARIGHPLTQGEIAEAAGISRQWYLFMENGRSVRVSTEVLCRIADVLMMSPSERTLLFRLAVPELRFVPLTRRSTPALDVILPFRDLMRELRTAATKGEVLKIAREYAVTAFACDAATTSMTVADRWVLARSGSEHERGAELDVLLQRFLGPSSGDYGFASGLTTQPGEVFTRSELKARFPKHAGVFGDALNSVDCPDLSFAKVYIPCRVGPHASLMLVDYQHREFTANERAQLIALAGIVSLALSA